MKTRRRVLIWAALVVGVSALLAGVASASQGGQWNTEGGNRQNARYQASEHMLSPSTIADLVPKWVLTTGGDVSATPAVDADTVYVPDWAGNLYAVDRQTGAQRWVVSLPGVTGVPGDKARATPAVTADKVIVGTQGPFGGGGRVLAFNKSTGEVVWSTQVDAHPAAVITQSATVFDGRVYVGVASQEEIFAAVIPGYPALSFRGSMAALDLETGQLLWKTYTAPDGYTGNAVLGSSPAIDTKRGQLYIATGNNYSVPNDVLTCVSVAGDDAAKAACLSPDDYFDSVMALDLKTGAVRWATRTLPYDAWNADCVPSFSVNDVDLCPDPVGPGYEFAQAPALFKVKGIGGKPVELVGAGQTSGQYWTFDPETGAIVWVTQTGPGGTRSTVAGVASVGGLRWGSAVDGTRVYTANANSDATPWQLPGDGTSTDGIWSGLDALTGEILWQASPPNGGTASGPVTTANGLVFGCAADPLGYMYALDAATGAVLWSFASGGSCISGAAISHGMLFWGSGYSDFGLGTANNELYAFGLPD